MNTAAITRGFHSLGRGISRKSPELLLGAGILSMAGAIVFTAKATMKIVPVQEACKERIENNDYLWEKSQEYIKDGIALEDGMVANEKEYKLNKVAINLVNVGSYAKLYAPAIAFGVVSVGCFISGHTIMANRYATAMAALSSVTATFSQYRSQVERYLTENNIDAADVFYTEKKEIVKNEDGTETEVVTKKATEGVGHSIYARFFDEYCDAWTKDPAFNLQRVLQIQSMFNDVLKARGVVYLNEVYDAFGMERRPEGQVVGWRYDLNRTDIDNCIDFGIYNGDSAGCRRFVNGLEPSILLDFNVDGDIVYA